MVSPTPIHRGTFIISDKVDGIQRNGDPHTSSAPTQGRNLAYSEYSAHSGSRDLEHTSVGNS